MAEKTVFTWADALAKDAQPEWKSGVVQLSLQHDQLTPFLPVALYTGERIEWVRQITRGEDAADFAASDAALIAVADQPINKVSADFEKVYTRAAEFACYFGVASRLERELTQMFSVRDAVRMSALQRVMAACSRLLWTPGASLVGTENRFDSLPDILDAEVFNAHRREANRLTSGKQQTHVGVVEEMGIPFGFKNLNSMRLWIDGPLTCYVAKADAIEDYEKLCRVAGNGGFDLYQSFQVPGVNDEVNAPTFKGIPWLRNEFIPVEADGYGEFAKCSRLYGLHLGGPYSLNLISSLGNTVQHVLIAREKNSLTDNEQLIYNMGSILPSIYTVNQLIYEVE